MLLVLSVVLATSVLGIVGLRESVSAQDVPPINKVLIRASVRVEDISRNDLADFVFNVDNDVFFYPGVLTSETVVPGPDGGLEGSEHLQTGIFNGFPFETYIVINKVEEGRYMIHQGDGLVSYKTIYTVRTGFGGNSAVFSTNSIVEGPGISADQISEFTSISFQNLLDYLGKDGNVWVSIAKDL